MIQYNEFITVVFKVLTHTTIHSMNIEKTKLIPCISRSYKNSFVIFVFYFISFKVR